MLDKYKLDLTLLEVSQMHIIFHPTKKKHDL
jgi:hypothetical protein